MISSKELLKLVRNATPEEKKLTFGEFWKKKVKEGLIDLSLPPWLDALKEASEKPKEDESLDVIIHVPLKSKKK